IRYFHVTGVQTCALPISTLCADEARPPLPDIRAPTPHRSRPGAVAPSHRRGPRRSSSLRPRRGSRQLPGVLPPRDAAVRAVPRLVQRVADPRGDGLAALPGEPLPTRGRVAAVLRGAGGVVRPAPRAGGSL